MSTVEELIKNVTAALRECRANLPAEARSMSEQLEQYANALEAPKSRETLSETLYEISYWKNLPDTPVPGLSFQEWATRIKPVSDAAFRAFRASSGPWWRRLFA